MNFQRERVAFDIASLLHLKKDLYIVSKNGFLCPGPQFSTGWVRRGAGRADDSFVKFKYEEYRAWVV